MTWERASSAANAPLPARHTPRRSHGDAARGSGRGTAFPEPNVVIAAGACAISGGMVSGHDEVVRGVGELLPVDLFVPGCPPHPLTILDGLLRLIGRVR